MSNLIWVRDKPTEQGYYFFKGELNSGTMTNHIDKIMVHVYEDHEVIDPENGIIQVVYKSEAFQGLSPVKLDDLEGYWFGPLPEPED